MFLKDMKDLFHIRKLKKEADLQKDLLKKESDSFKREVEKSNNLVKEFKRKDVNL